MKLSKFQPSEKLFKRYDDKIKIEKYEGPAFNKVLEQGRRADKDRLEWMRKNAKFGCILIVLFEIWNISDIFQSTTLTP